MNRTPGMKDLFGDQFYGSSYARATDPQTSHDAARSVDAIVARMEGLVLRYIVSRAFEGATWDEVAAGTGIDKATVSPRFKPLRERGLIEAIQTADGGQVRRPGKSGRGQTVWIATQKGKGL